MGLRALQCSTCIMQAPDIHEPQMDLMLTYALLPNLVGKLLVETTSLIIELIASFYRQGTAR